MQAAWIPSNICSCIDQMCRRFHWSSDGIGKGWHMVSWSKLTNIRSAGGLGIRDARKANTALLGKLVWKMLKEPDCPWVRLLSSIYLRGTQFWTTTCRVMYPTSGGASLRLGMSYDLTFRSCFSEGILLYGM